jgi:hypothetical protein
VVGTEIIAAISAGVGKALSASGAAAIGRLVGATAEVPAAWLDGVAQGLRDKTEARAEISRALAEEVAKAVSGDPDVVNRAMKSMTAKWYRSQVNKEAVAKVAAVSLQALPAPEDGSAPTEQFMTSFERYAGDAADDDLRTMFGRLLAGEVRSPHSVPLAALHFVSMLDQASAQLIQRVLPICWIDLAVLDAMPTKLNVHDISTLEQIGFWSAEKNLPITIGDDSLKMLIPRSDKGVVLQGRPGEKFVLDVAILSPAGKALVAVSEIGVNFPWLFEALQKKGVNFMGANRPIYEGNVIRVSGPYSEKFGIFRQPYSFSKDS